VCEILVLLLAVFGANFWCLCYVAVSDFFLSFFCIPLLPLATKYHYPHQDYVDANASVLPIMSKTLSTNCN